MRKWAPPPRGGSILICYYRTARASWRHSIVAVVPEWSRQVRRMAGPVALIPAPHNAAASEGTVSPNRSHRLNVSRGPHRPFIPLSPCLTAPLIQALT